MHVLDGEDKEATRASQTTFEVFNPMSRESFSSKRDEINRIKII